MKKLIVFIGLSSFLLADLLSLPTYIIKETISDISLIKKVVTFVEEAEEIYDYKKMEVLIAKENCSLQEREENHFVMNCTKERKINLFEN